jgi:hypothetical protein
MNLHQIHLSYRLDEDRILCQASFKAEDGSLHEARAALTRRVVKSLWTGIVDAMGTQVTLNKPEAAHAKAEIISMEHEACVTAMKDGGNFSTPYQPVQAYPLGDVPILVTRLDFMTAPNQPIRVKFTLVGGQFFEIAYTPSVLHGFCAMLQDIVQQAQWDMELVLPGAAANAAAPAMLN